MFLRPFLPACLPFFLGLGGLLLPGPATAQPALNFQWKNASNQTFSPAPAAILLGDGCFWAAGCAAHVIIDSGSGAGGPGNLATAQVSVGTTAGLIAAGRTARQTVTVVNTSTTDIYIGGSGVTTSSGLLLPGVKGASLTLAFTGALYGVVASGTATVTEAETY